MPVAIKILLLRSTISVFQMSKLQRRARTPVPQCGDLYLMARLSTLMLPLEIDILCLVRQFRGSFEHEHDAAVATLWRALARCEETPRVWPRRRPCEVGTSTSTILWLWLTTNLQFRFPFVSSAPLW